MAPITKTLALAGAFFALTGYSAPVAKRAVVWETVTDIVWTTIDVTTTIYPQATQTATVVPVVASAVPTTTVAPVVEAPTTNEVEKAAPATTSTTSTTTSSSTSSTTSSTTTTAAAPTVETSMIEKAAPTTSSSSTTTAAPAAPTAPAAPAVEAEPSSAPASVVEAQTSSAPAPAATRAATTEPTSPQTTSSGRTGVCSESSPCEGDITYYDTATTATNPSSCGTTNDGTVENVLALPHGIMTDSDCGKTVTITYNGQTATGIVVDKCMGCDNGSVDLSRHLFGELASMDKGRVEGVKWYIN
ncbi:Barwin-related endoglucanase [Penicillium italicum]|uniref:Barwin-related endoglucanase n=1 Tax=Penicillium italicum TaxID=40296 RepID=A0A0A2KVP8_PENIT|nr:Barwin-related endoglucanase [Penicillium italicum]